MNQSVYLNGRLVRPGEARVSILSGGFLYGEGLFETMRSYNQNVFALDRHIERLIKGAKQLNLKLNWPESKIKKAVLITVGASDLNHAYVRLNLWRQDKESNLCCFIKRLRNYPPGLYRRGFKTIISQMRINESSLLCRIKSFNYLFYKLAGQEARERNADEAILLNSKGYIAEGSRSNIFIVKGRRLITPALESGCLPGITRSIVLELAERESLQIKEKLIRPQELFNADEAFLTNSLMEVMPIARVNNRLIGSGFLGKRTGLLLSKYRGLTKNLLK